MVEQYNPFKENRTEQMRDLWKYYVPFSSLDGAGKPLVVEGGRGSGKTMLFQCNSWRQIMLQIKKNGDLVTDILDKKEFIGIYYRVDTTFVASMREREEQNWSAIFETYLSICLLKEFLDLISALNENMDLDAEKISEFSQTFSKKLCPQSSIDSINLFKTACDEYLDAIENKINGSNIDSKFRYVKTNRFVTDLCVAFGNLVGRENLLFKIFIDEYETLQEYQQKIINTFIKHSSLPVVFNIGMRPKGMKTSGTISETETIEAPHDYEVLPLGFDEKDYPKIVKDICQKRIVLGKEQGKIPVEASEDIEYYLGNYSLEYELNEIEQVKMELSHLDKLRELIKERGTEEGLTETEIIDYSEKLCDDAPILNSRIHYALLCKKTQYTPKLTQLYDSYEKNDERYADWMHNRKNGAIFLLCKESKREKMYYGFDVYTALSSNIVRYFLELCEHAFKIAFLNGYSWDKPIPEKMQSEAARYVSDYKVDDIAGYEPFGKELRIFVQYLGQIFYKLHTDEENTLGEPEPNHFYTKDLSLPPEIKNLIASAVMWNVLQEGETTKKKQSKLSPETVDYYLNKIYVPYFGISYRSQRKIFLDVNILENLFSGEESVAKKGWRNYFQSSKNGTTLSLDQISLFDNCGGNL